MKGGNDAGNPFLPNNQHAKNPFSDTIQAKNNPFLSGRENTNNPFLSRKEDTTNTWVIQKKQNPDIHTEAHKEMETVVNFEHKSDMDDNFFFDITEYNTDMESSGLKKEAYNIFKKVIHNAYNLLIKGNDRAKNALMFSTGLTESEVLEMDIEKKINRKQKRPKITFNAMGTEASPDGKSINFSIESINQFMNEKTTPKQRFDHALAMAMTVIHEFIHFADMNKNNLIKPGSNGTEKLTTGQNDQDSYDPKTQKTTVSGSWSQDGKQKWNRSFTGHRGSDFELYSYGVLVENFKHAPPQALHKEGLHYFTTAGSSASTALIPHTIKSRNKEEEQKNSGNHFTIGKLPEKFESKGKTDKELEAMYRNTASIIRLVF